MLLSVRASSIIVRCTLVWSVLFDSIQPVGTWRLALEGHAKSRGTVSPSLCGTLIELSIKIYLVNWSR